MADWPDKSLAELYTFSSGLSKPRSAFGSGYPFLTFKDVFYNYTVPNELTERVQSTEQERSSCSIKRGDVFLTRTSETIDELGMSCVALRDYPGATFNGFTKRLRPRPNAPVVPEFAAYYFRSPRFRRQVTAMASLSTRASLNNGMLERVSIALPPIDEQLAVAGVLRPLDDKIALNRQMAEMLTSLAASLFKSWFVDFDPVHAKAEGRDPGLPQQIAALFPDCLVDSELGELPAGWRPTALGDPDVFPLVSSGIGAGDPRRLYIDTGNVGRGTVAGEVQVLVDARPSRANMQPGSGRVWFAKMKDSPKYLWTLGEHDDWWSRRVLSTGFFGVASRPAAYESLLYCFVSSRAFDDAKNSLASGTTMQALNLAGLTRIKIALPPVTLGETFDRLVRPMFLRASHCYFEQRTLTTIRDALMPKLVSGAMRVPQAERLLETSHT